MKHLSILILTVGFSIQSQANTVSQVIGASSGPSTEERCSDGIPKHLLDQYTEQSTRKAYELAYEYCHSNNISEVKDKTVLIHCQKSMIEEVGGWYTPWVDVKVKLTFSCDGSNLADRSENL